jgi:CRISPR-associated protein Cmr1
MIMRKPPSKRDGSALEIPEVKPEPSRKRSGEKFDELAKQEFRYELITPLFGGGVDASTPDLVTIIRGTGLRGQLRFWWRACRGGQFGSNLSEMQRAEDAIWGAAGSSERTLPSPVQVFITIDDQGIEDRPFEVGTNRSGKPEPRWRQGSIVPEYAAFPLKPEKEGAVVGMETKAVRVGVKFTLRITFPRRLQTEVESALWAWETFGGIGARTRRGFGAICRLDSAGKRVAPSISEVKNKIGQGLEQHVVDGAWPAGVPHLTRTMACEVVTDKIKSPVEAWDHLIKKLERFRQYRDGKFGPSLWPEAEAIRSLAHRPSRVKDDSRTLIKKFPRAAFGLPIIFHFKDLGELESATLKGGLYDKEQGKYRERLASPLILRPLACAGGAAVGLAIILESRREPPEGLVLTGEGLTETVSADLTEDDAKHIPPLRNERDVLRAFINDLRSRRDH